MTVAQLMDILDAEKLTSDVSLSKEVSCGYVCDLLSWVMAHGMPGTAWVTVQTHLNVIAVAVLMEFACIILPEGIDMEDSSLQKAQSEGIPVLRSKRRPISFAGKWQTQASPLLFDKHMNIYVDLHIHSCLSPCADGDMTPWNICAMAKIKSLHAIAVTDHNSARNLPAVRAAAGAYGLVLLPGIEITTREEVHLLAYFPTVEQAMAMGDFLYDHLPDIKNNPRLFGEQQVMNERDEVTGVEHRLLISATDLPLHQAVHETKRFGGIAVPAHINRGANGLLTNLGFLPDDVLFPALEVAHQLPVAEDILQGKIILHSSDAHRLENISEAVYSLDVAELSPAGILKTLG